MHAHRTTANPQTPISADKSGAAITDAFNPEISAAATAAVITAATIGIATAITVAERRLPVARGFNPWDEQSVGFVAERRLLGVAR